MADNQSFVISRVEEGQAALQARFQELGYLFFKRYVHAQDCDQMLAALVAQTRGQVEYRYRLALQPVFGPFYYHLTIVRPLDPFCQGGTSALRSHVRFPFDQAYPI